MQHKELRSLSTGGRSAGSGISRGGNCGLKRQERPVGGWLKKATRLASWASGCTDRPLGHRFAMLRPPFWNAQEVAGSLGPFAKLRPVDGLSLNSGAPLEVRAIVHVVPWRRLGDLQGTLKLGLLGQYL